jgi:hypothetical protein
MAELIFKDRIVKRVPLKFMDLGIKELLNVIDNWDSTRLSITEREAMSKKYIAYCVKDIVRNNKDAKELVGSAKIQFVNFVDCKKSDCYYSITFDNGAEVKCSKVIFNDSDQSIRRTLKRY